MTTPTNTELLATLDELRTRITELEARSDLAASASPSRPVKTRAESRRVSRKGMLKTAALGTAGVVGALLIEPAGAAMASSSEGQTSFSSATSTPTVKATNTKTGNAIQATTGSGTSIHGSQTSDAANAVAIRGSIDSKQPGAGTGVVGAASAGTGVSGSSNNGTGVTGTATSGTGVKGTSATGVGVEGATASAKSSAVAVQGTISSATPGSFSAGVYGLNKGTGGSGIGVYGSQAGSGWGVYGTAPSGIGVYGYSADGTGASGGSASGNGVNGTSSTATGVSGTSSSGNGVSGTSSSSTGVRGASSSGYGAYGTSSSNYGVAGVTTSGNGVYGQVSTATQAGVVGRQTDSSGNWALYGFGNIGASGTKSAVVPAADGKGHVTLYCMESPECWFEDFGSATLVHGAGTVQIDPEFAQTINTSGYHVFLQPEGDCKGLSVRNKDANGFDVRELEDGASNVRFAYRIVGIRKDVSAPRLKRATLPDASPM